jgi:hypothetical protein
MKEVMKHQRILREQVLKRKVRRKRMFKNRYWVYEIDSFMIGFYQDEPDIEPQKKFLFRFLAKLHQLEMVSKMSRLGESSKYLKYKILKARRNETFQQAYQRINGGN